MNQVKNNSQLNQAVNTQTMGQLMSQRARLQPGAGHSGGNVGVSNLSLSALQQRFAADVGHARHANSAAHADQKIETAALSAIENFLVNPE